jgi:two-component system, response regulator YesN
MNVVIVDDELTAVAQISSMDLWDDASYTLIGTAKNGKEGLSLLQRYAVDILITDIEMPVMDGLKLIEEVRSRGYPVDVIILSCHESFTYARAAMLLGVEDYLIKDFLEEQTLRAALERVRSIRGRRTARASADPAAAGRRSDPGFAGLIDGMIASRDPELERRAAALIPEGCKVLLCMIHTDGYQEQRHTAGDLLRVVNRTVTEECPSPGVPRREQLTCLDHGDSLYISYVQGSTTGEQIAVWLQQVITNAQKLWGLSLTIAWERLYRCDESLLSGYDACSVLLRYRPFLGNGRLILPSHMQSISYIDADSLSGHIRELHRLGKTGCPDEIIPLIRRLYSRCLPGMLQLNYLKFLNSHVLAVLLQLIDAEGFDLEQLFGRSYLPLHELDLLDTADAMCLWFERKFRRIGTRQEALSLPEVSNIRVRGALEIIKRDYSDCSLDLETIAGETGVHKGYLSRVFKEETGSSCYDFLQHYRVQRAQSLLKGTVLKVYEIAERTGFHSYDQFCVVFRKCVGVSPTHYRKKGENP